MKEYKKTYKGLVLFLFLYMAVFFLLDLGTPQLNEKGKVLLSLQWANFGIVLLMFFIYKTERIYWFTGLSFEEAKRANSQNRKAYAWWHVKYFGLVAFFYGVYSIFSYFMGFPAWWDTILFVIFLGAVAVRSIKVKLDKF